MKSHVNTLLCAVVCACAASATADVIYETPDPFGGPFGLVGFDVFAQQSVAVRFTSTGDYYFTRASMWIMSNDFGGVSNAQVRVTLRTDDNNGTVSIPSDVILDEMFFNVSAIGWDPVLESVDSVSHPALVANANYWLVLECDATNSNPVWNWAGIGSGFTSNTSGNQTVWQPGGTGAVAATIIEGVQICYPDCDGSGSLSIFDYICFGNAYASQNPYADCDGSGSFNIFDYICFGNQYGSGCP
ncbi:MAG: hypothetical protein H6815_03995 [Phycisphaeraceae bacterium]|nr:hypothetical protein [Phycisphaerales bacterium]MCB9859592.1 hypothetical protein [Phycisphaeraceae bacterium]